MRWLRRIWYKLVPTYKRTAYAVYNWVNADALIKSDPRWRIAEEDQHFDIPLVALEKVERITE